jgi:23S rRNA maturation mini-RNase III
VTVKRRKYDTHDPEAKHARARVLDIIDSVSPEQLVQSIKRAPSLRGMILGYIAEEMFEVYVRETYPELIEANIEKHDDHDRRFNKSDRTITHAGRIYRIQLKSIQTNSIKRCLNSGRLRADVQNDASDRRSVTFADGSTLETTCYLRGDYDILAVPLFPFTGNWTFAYKRNVDCRSSASEKYTDEQKNELLATTEILEWPLRGSWSDNLYDLLDDKIGLIAQPVRKV